jgi:FixJ family two-component response regulator
MNGLDVLERLKITGLNIPVIFYGKVQSVSKGVTAVKLGALDFLLMPAEDALIIKAIEDGLNLSAEQYAISSTRQTLQTKLNVLSPREQEVFYLLIKGYSNAELVSTLGISLDTVKQYKTSVMRKLEAKSLSQLMGLVAARAVQVPAADALEGRS